MRALQAMKPEIRQRPASPGGTDETSAKRKVCLQIFHRLAICLRIRIDKIIQGIAFLIGREANVAAVGEEKLDWCRAHRRRSRAWQDFSRPRKRLRGPIRGRRDRTPPSNGSPGYRLPSLPSGNGKTDFKSRGNAGRAHHADEQGMEIGAIAPL